MIPLAAKLSPLVGTLRSYKREDLRHDLVAGLTTAVMLVPQGMAYAMLAGLPPEVGLYAAAFPAIVYAFLGTSSQLSVGPVAMDSILVAAGVGALVPAGSDDYLAYAAALSVMAGLIQLLMGSLRLGFVVNFLSHPVISGFTSAAALIIALSQVRHLTGIALSSGTSFFAQLGELGRRASEISPITGLFSAGAIVLLMGLRKYAPKLPRALLVVVLGTGLTFLLGEQSGIAIVGEVPAGLPTPSLPAVDSAALRALLPTSFVIALVAFMESISVSQAYARKTKQKVIPNRELIALGASNILGGFLRGYPVTGGFSRTAVNADAGARTNVAGLVTSALVIAALLFLTPAFYYLPKAVLAAIIVTAVVGLIDFSEVKRLRKVKHSDLALLLLTFAATLTIGIVPGMLTGVGASLAWFIIRSTRPHIAVLGRIPGTRTYRNVERQEGLITYPGIVAIRMDAQFYFGNVSFLRSTLERLEEEAELPLRAVVLDASAMNNLDSSALTALGELYEDYQERGILLYLSTIKGPVRDVLDASELSATFGSRANFRSVQDAIDAALQELSEIDSREGPTPTSRQRPERSQVKGGALDGPAARHPRGNSYVI